MTFHFMFAPTKPRQSFGGLGIVVAVGEQYEKNLPLIVPHAPVQQEEPHPFALHSVVVGFFGHRNSAHVDVLIFDRGNQYPCEFSTTIFDHDGAWTFGNEHLHPYATRIKTFGHHRPVAHVS